MYGNGGRVVKGESLSGGNKFSYASIGCMGMCVCVCVCEWKWRERERESKYFLMDSQFFFLSPFLYQSEHIIYQ